MSGSSSERPPFKLILSRAVLGLVPVTLVPFLMLACGSDGDQPTDGDPATPSISTEVTQPQSLSDYYGALTAGFDRLSNAATTAEPGELTDTSQLLPFLKESLNEYSIAMNDFAAEVDGLRPPPQVADEHSKFRDALMRDAEATGALAQEVREADSLLEASRAIESRPNQLLESREPCKNLQAIASREGVTVTLPCDE